MKNLDEIRAYWTALPGATYFANAFQSAIGDVEVAEVDMRTADAAALTARGRHRAALAALRQQVEAEAMADWSPTEIEAARAAALRCSLELAATPRAEPAPSLPEWPATTAEDVMRHRRLAREAIGH